MKKLFSISTIVVLLDLLSKQSVVHFLLENQRICLIKNFFYLTYVKNTGVAFSMLEGKLFLIILMTIIIILFLLQYLKKIKATSNDIISYALIIGGALGNLLDRLLYGYVIDFLEFHIFRYHFPIFNLADTSIVIGTFLLLLMGLKESRDKNETNIRNQNENR